MCNSQISSPEDDDMGRTGPQPKVPPAPNTPSALLLFPCLTHLTQQGALCRWMDTQAAHSSFIPFPLLGKHPSFLLATPRAQSVHPSSAICPWENWHVKTSLQAPEAGLGHVAGNFRVPGHQQHALEEAVQASLSSMGSWMQGEGHIWRGARAGFLNPGSKAGSDLPVS